MFPQKTVIRASKNSDYKTGAAHTEKAKRKPKKLFFLAFFGKFYYRL